MNFDTQAFVWGLLSGLPASALFFGGLAWGMRRALRSRQPALVLLVSFFVRAGVLLGLGVWLLRSMHPLWVLAGYLLAFVLVRIVAVRYVRSGQPAQQGGS